MPPFWAQAYGSAAAPHAVSVRVTPAVAIASSSVANPSVITTATPHGLASGDTVAIAGHLGSTPAVDGARVVTVLSTLSFSIPLQVTVGGTGGTVTRTIAADLLSLAEVKAYARLSTTDTSLDALFPRFLASARAKVQQDTGIVLLAETYDVFFDALPRDRTPVELPWRPVATVSSIVSIDTAGNVQTLGVSNYTLDASSEAPYPARLGLTLSGAWPSDLRPFQPYVMRLVAGFASAALVPPALVQAVGMLAGFYANEGSTRYVDATLADTYEDTIAPYRLVCVA